MNYYNEDMKKLTINFQKRSFLYFSRIWIGFLFIVFSAVRMQAQTDTGTIMKDTITEVKKGDTTRIVLGKKQIQIIDAPSKDNGDDQVSERSDNEKEDAKEKHGWHSGGFKGHWSGLEVGLNNYLNSDHSMSLSGTDEFMSLNTNRSLNVNLNFMQHSFGIIGNRFGMVSGMGLEFYNYFFDNNNSIQKDADGVIISKPYDPIDLDKSKLTITYLTIPILFEFQFPGQLSHSHRLRLSVGIIGGLKLGAHTKVVYRENGDKQKEKKRDDFNLNSWRYGFTGRIGYKHLSVFTNYYPVTLFEKNKGPVLYPISMGIALQGN
jgi:hypothetical protein